MTDQELARMRAHHNNIHRYRRLLQTKLTDLERNFVDKRLAEEQSSLAALVKHPRNLWGLRVWPPRAKVARGDARLGYVRKGLQGDFGPRPE